MRTKEMEEHQQFVNLNEGVLSLLFFLLMCFCQSLLPSLVSFQMMLRPSTKNGLIELDRSGRKGERKLFTAKYVVMIDMIQDLECRSSREIGSRVGGA